MYCLKLEIKKIISVLTMSNFFNAYPFPLNLRTIFLYTFDLYVINFFGFLCTLCFVASFISYFLYDIDLCLSLILNRYDYIHRSKLLERLFL